LGTILDFDFVAADGDSEMEDASAIGVALDRYDTEIHSLAPEIIRQKREGDGHCFYYSLIPGSVYDDVQQRTKLVQDWRGAIAVEVISNPALYWADLVNQVHVMSVGGDTERTRYMLPTAEFSLLSEWCTSLSTGRATVYKAADVPHHVWSAWEKCQQVGLWAGSLSNHTALPPLVTHTVLVLLAGWLQQRAFARMTKKELFVATFDARSETFAFGKHLPVPRLRQRPDGSQVQGVPGAWYTGLDKAAAHNELLCASQDGSAVGFVIFNGTNHYERGDACFNKRTVNVVGQDGQWHMGLVIESRHTESQLLHRVQYDGDDRDDQWIDFTSNSVKFEVHIIILCVFIGPLDRHSAGLSLSKDAFLPPPPSLPSPVFYIADAPDRQSKLGCPSGRINTGWS
jgi:hypothetical protein